MAVMNKISATFTVLQVFICVISAKYEDDPCSDPMGTVGTCKTLEGCPTALQRIKMGIPHKMDRCGFRGSIEIVCCTDVPGTGPVQDEDEGSVWDTDDPVIPTKTKDKSGTSAEIPITITRKAQRKTETVCEEYSNELPLAVDFHILGGDDVEMGEFPHMCALGYQTSEGMSWQCGGSLISNQYVMTAAHCIINPDSQKPSKVRLGAVNIEGPADEYDIENITVHSSFMRRTSANDIALIRLAKKVTFSKNVHPACLYTKLDDPIGLWVTGWGYIDNEGSERSNILQKALLQPVPMDRCNATYVKRSRRLSTSQMCAGSPNGKQDSCRGDSGGPLQIFTKENLHSVVGIISFGVGCGGNVPAVYTRVASYLDWIEPIVWPESK